MTSPRVLLVPLLTLSTACGARTLISESGTDEEEPLRLSMDGGVGFHRVPALSSSPIRDQVAPEQMSEPPVVQATPPVPIQPDVNPSPPPPDPVATSVPETPPVVTAPAATGTALPVPTTPVPEPVPLVEPEVPVEPEAPLEPEAPPVEGSTGTCANPTSLDSRLGVVATGSNAYATDEHQASCGAEGGREVVFSWVAPAKGYYAFSTLGSTYDTTLVLLEDPGCSEELACNDDSAGTASHLLMDLDKDQVITIALDAFASDAAGEYALDISEVAIEECAPIALGSTRGLVAEGLLFSDAASFGTLSDCNGGSRRINFSWTAPESTTYRFDTAGSDFDTVLVLRPECGLPAHICNDDSFDLTSSVDWDLASGESVIIELSMYGDEPGSGALGNGSPNYRLNIEAANGPVFYDAGTR